MPYRSYSSIDYFTKISDINYQSLTITKGIWLANIASIWCDKYNYTYSTERFESLDESREKLNNFLSKLDPSNIAERYKMRKFVYDTNIQIQNVIFSSGTLWIGNGENLDGSYRGKVDFQTAVRSICREEIEYALWNYTSKLIENNEGEKLLQNLKYQNIDSFRLKWFFYSKFPLQDITVNGFPIGTDDTEFNTINNNINLIKKIFIPDK